MSQSDRPSPLPAAQAMASQEATDPTGRAEREPPVLHALQFDRRATLNRAHAAAFSCAVLALLYHRALSLLSTPTPLSSSLLLALTLSDLIFAFMWALYQAFRWRPVHRREFPERLPLATDRAGWPALDVFVCTADPDREPPVTVANTALSAMAFDYPPGGLSVYVSDDGGSEVTLYAMVEAARFARRWLPFCRENRLVERCPEAFFRSGGGGGRCEEIKVMYETMKQRVESAVEGGLVASVQDLTKEEREVFRKWTTGFKRDEHPAVVQILLETGKDVDVAGYPLPNLVYVSREKSGTSPHHFKAGALNALLRVSGTMTNAPVILTLDCDMHSNDPQAPQRALCYLLDSEEAASRLAYVQFSLNCHGLDRDDIYGNEHKRILQINPPGMDGAGGPDYSGSGCFFSRRSLFGGPSSPSPLSQGNLTNRLLTGCSISSEEVLRNAHQVASCSFERDTQWGSKMGFRYGSLVEDYFSSYCLHCEGWKSLFCNPPRPAFLGDAPITLNDALGQIKRWTVGLMEVIFSKYCPLTFGIRRAPLLTSMCFAYYALWGIWCVPMMTYAFVPQIALFHQVALFPKVSDPWIFIYAYIFLAAYAQDAMEFLLAGGTVQRWWNDQRIWMIRGVTSHPFGVIEFLLKQIGISNFGFNITSKVMEDEQVKRYREGIMDFGVASPFFVSLGTIAIVNLIAFLVGLAKALRHENTEDMFAQLFISGFVVVNSWPVYEAMVLRRDGGRMPGKVTIISISLTGVLCYASYFIFKVYGSI